MTALERLARRICWLGFNSAGRRDHTEAAYWASLPMETHQSYIVEASTLVVNMLAINRSNASQDLFFAVMDGKS